MDTRKTRDLPARLEAVRRRFERWRRTRRPPSRIPDPLWVVAVKLVGRYGIHRTARALRVDYYSLKKRVTAASAAHHSRPTPTMRADHCCAAVPGPVGARAVSGSLSDEGATTFVELPSPVDPGFAAVPAACGECILELESVTGAKMRVQLKGVTMPDLTALSRSFWDHRP